MNSVPSTLTHRARLWCATTGLFAVAVLVVGAQSTNDASHRLDYTSFRIIADKNIFNPNRSGARLNRVSRRTENRRVPAADAFALVGTIAYEKGTFAFFDGTMGDYKKILETGGVVAGHKVKEITPTTVKLEIDGKEMEMKVGTQMQREDGKWRLSSLTTIPLASIDESSESSAASAAPPESGAAAESNPIIRKLMLQREQESK